MFKNDLSPGNNGFNFKELPLLKLSYFRIFAAGIIILTGCEKQNDPSESDILNSTVWGQISECGTAVQDPELYTCIFRSDGHYLTYYKVFETANYLWRLDGGTLYIGSNAATISSLKSDFLEIKFPFKLFNLIDADCFCQFKALQKSRLSSVGVSGLSPSTARLHGYLRTNDLTDISFEYGTSSSYGSVISCGSFSGPANEHVFADLTGLIPETIYHFRIRAENSAGTPPGEDMVFRTCNSINVGDADGNLYNTITIGNQTWMAENLKTTKYNNGQPIPLVRDSLSWMQLSTPAYSWYKNDSVSCKDKYGALYNWYTINTGKLCPAGWHVPTENEWNILIGFLGYGAGNLMTEGHYNIKLSIAFLEAENSSGFSARQGVLRDCVSSYDLSDCKFWSSTQVDEIHSINLVVHSSFAGSESYLTKKFGLPVRCLKD